MTKQLTSIDLNFENCETGNIPLDAIEYINIGGITKKQNISLNALLKSDADYTEKQYLACQSLDLILNLDLVKHLATNFYTESSTSPSPLLTHLVTWPDIVDINLNYQDKTHKDIYMPWKSIQQNELDTNNLYQVKNIYKTKLEIIVADDLKTNYNM